MEDRYKDEEITLKQLIQKIQDYSLELLKGWRIVLIFSLMFMAYFLNKHYNHVSKYNANLRFVVEGQGGVSNALGGLLGSFGIKKNGNLNPYKIIEVGKSSKLFQRAIFSPFDENQTLADKIIDEYNLIDLLSGENESYSNFRFVSHDLEREIERKMFKVIFELVWGNSSRKKMGITQLNLDEEKGIYTIVTSSTSEKLSISLANKIYDGIKIFFENEVFENQKRSSEILRIKTDSIKNLRYNKIKELARFEDASKGLVYRINSTKKVELNSEIQALGLAYSELIKNYEITDVNLKDLQPLFMEIDKPFSPIYPTSSSLFRNIFMGLLFGSFIGVIIVLVRRVYRDVMK